MKWIKDCELRRVNIDNYDVMGYRDIVDNKTCETIAHRIYVSKGNEILTLGWIKQKQHMDGKDVLEQICCGVDVHFECLQDIIYDCIEKTFDEKSGESFSSKDFSKRYDLIMEMADNLIDERFVEE